LVISRETVRSRLIRLESSLAKLRELAKLTKGEFLDGDNYVPRDLTDRNLQVAAECIFDIGNHIIAEDGFGSPSDYEDIIKILSNNGVISKGLAKRLRGLGGFRNILVHDYMGIDYSLVYSRLKNNLKDFSDFIREIERYIGR